MLQSQQVVANAPRKLNTVTFSDACGSNNLESLSGIETIAHQVAVLINIDGGSNNLESLSGIETRWVYGGRVALPVPITLNPYQGLKLNLNRACSNATTGFQ